MQLIIFDSSEKKNTKAIEGMCVEFHQSHWEFMHKYAIIIRYLLWIKLNFWPIRLINIILPWPMMVNFSKYLKYVIQNSAKNHFFLHEISLCCNAEPGALFTVPHRWNTTKRGYNLFCIIFFLELDILRKKCFFVRRSSVKTARIINKPKQVCNNEQQLRLDQIRN